jgi:hypothetical protein
VECQLERIKPYENLSGEKETKEERREIYKCRQRPKLAHDTYPSIQSIKDENEKENEDERLRYH